MAALFGLDQHFRYKDGHTQDRHWQIRRIDDRHYLGRANDVVGAARGEVIGATFRFSYIVALKPPSFHVRLDQTMTLLRDGEMWTLTHKISSAIGVTELVRVTLESGRATPRTGRGLGAVVGSDGYVLVPDGSEGYEPGAILSVYR